MTKTFKVFMLSLISLFSLANQVFATSPDYDSRYEQAIVNARQGKFTPALAELEYLLKKRPDNKTYRYDYIQVLAWARRNENVLQQSKKINLSQSPAYVVEAIAGAARNIDELEQAEHLYRSVLARFNDRVESKVGLAGVLIDQHNVDDAIDFLQRAEKQHPNDIGILSMLAYAHEENEEFVSAYVVYEKILSIKADHQPALKGRVFALRRSGAVVMALEKATPMRSIFSDQEWARLHADVAAYKVRWGELSPVSGKLRYADTDEAIEGLHYNIRLFDQLKLANAEEWKTNTRFDLMLALRDKKQMEQVLVLYQSMLEKDVEFPAFAEIVAADAFLYREQPEQARDLYLSVLEKEPKNYNAKLSLIYAYVECEQHDEAIHTAKQLSEVQHSVLAFRIPDNDVDTYLRGNQKKTDSELVSAETFSYADYYDDAQHMLESLHHRAPFNTDIRNELAGLYSVRGWNRRARQEFEIGIQTTPDHIGLQTGLNETLLELRHFQESEKGTNNLAVLYPEYKEVQHQKHLWDVHNDRELQMYADGGTSNGSTQGSDFVGVEAYLYSAPMNYNYRMFLHSRWRTGTFDGVGRGDELLYGLGIEYAMQDILLSTELHYDESEKDELAWNVNLIYDFNDQWQFSTGFDSQSSKTPLQARVNGITSMSGNFILRYQTHESRELELSTDYLNFNDGNDRVSVAGRYFERWVTGPIYKFSTIVNLAYSNNSKIDAVYFNPQSDVYSALTLDNDWLTYRHYDFSFHQRVALTGGNYQQQSFGSHIVGNIRYEHRWQADERFELVYGGIRNYQVFDGTREEGWEYYLNLNLRF